MGVDMITARSEGSAGNDEARRITVVLMVRGSCSIRGPGKF